MRPLTFADAPGWTFDLDETSTNVYRILGHHSDGRIVELSGTDPEDLIERCRREAMKMLSAPDGAAPRPPEA